MFCYSLNNRECNESSGERKMKTKELPIPYQNKYNNNNKIINFFKNQRFDEKQKGEVVVQNLKISIWGKRKEMVLANRWQTKKKSKTWTGIYTNKFTTLLFSSEILKLF